VREVAMRLESFRLDDKIMVSLAKGVEFPPTRRMSEILGEVLGNRAMIAVMSGPNFADEILAGQCTVTTIAASDSSILERVRDVLWTDSFSVQTSHDLKGVELCGVLKNVYSIAMGICDAMNLGKNAYYCVLNQAYNEMKDLVLCSGGNLETMFLSCGLGDFVLTASSDKSRNRTVGLLYGKGLMNTEVGTGAVQEGKKSIMVAMEIGSNGNVKHPVAEFVHDVVWKREDPNEAFRRLWPRMQGSA
jgi:glycerol-3-phosphate dehydrogenase (NAD(P)+)